MSGESGEAGESEESGETGDPGICEDPKPETPVSFDIDVSGWPVAFEAGQASGLQILSCTLTATGIAGPVGAFVAEFDCSDGTNSGEVRITIFDIATDTTVASDAPEFELELYAGLPPYGGDTDTRPRELGAEVEEFILRDGGGLVLGGFDRSSEFRPVWDPIGLSHAPLCNLEENYSDVPHREGGLEAWGGGDERIVLRAGEVGDITAGINDHRFRVYAGKADTWGCCHGGWSNDGVITRRED